MNTITENILAAVEQFALGISVPLIYQQNDVKGVIGTGTLFKIAGRHFIVTAEHVVRGIALDDLSFPLTPKAGQIHTFGVMDLHRIDRAGNDIAAEAAKLGVSAQELADALDVAVVELKAPKTIERLEAGWTFCSLENVSLELPATNERPFVLFGYPGQLGTNGVDKVTAAITTAYLHKLDETPAEAKRPILPGIDLFLNYRGTPITPNKMTIQELTLPGTSGGSICTVSPVQGLWTPQQSLRIVAVQSSYRRQDFARGKRWRLATRILSGIDDTVATAVRGHFDLAS